MRILNIIQCANLGGMEQANLQRLLGLRAAGHEIELLSLHPVGALGPVLARHGIPACGLAYRGRGGWRSVRTLRRALAAVSADALIMTGHNLLAMLALGDTCRGRRVLALHYHHTDVKPAWQWRLVYRAALRRFKAITFPSDFVRREAEALYPPIASISHTVRDPMSLPGPVDPGQRTRARQALGLPPDAKIIGTLRVMRAVSLAEPKALGVIAGDGPERAQLTRLCEELGLADRVVWLGWQERTADVYRSLDVMLFNSDWDALGRAPLEALSHGIPLVASLRHGGLGEILDRTQHCTLLDRHDTSALAEAVLGILRNPVGAQAQALAARDHIRQVTSTARHTAALSRLLALA